MRWLILILILSSLFLVGCCNIETFEKEPVLEQYILIRVEDFNESLESSSLTQDNVNEPFL